MKVILSNILTVLEELATKLASMETALVQNGVLGERDLDLHVPIEGVVAQNNLVLLRQMISALPDETPKRP
jgi:hypothetical protein